MSPVPSNWTPLIFTEAASAVAVAAFVALLTVVPAITEDNVDPLTVIASASKVPSTSTSPLISMLDASICPTLIFA